MGGHSLSVLYLIENCGHGGAEVQIAMQASRLAALGHRPLVAAPGSGWLFDEVSRAGVPFISLSRYKSKASPLTWVREIGAIISAHQVQIVQAYLLQMNVCGAIAARRKGIPAVASVRGRAYDFDRRWRLWAYRLLARSGVTFTTPSEDLRAALIRAARLPSDCVLAIHNGVDVASLARGFERSDDADLPAGYRIGYVGRLDRRKGLEQLLEAMVIIADHIPGARLIIIGDGPLRPELEAQRRALGISDRVAFLGHRADATALLPRLDAFVQPSLSEGLSNSLLEAMAAGLPIVATDIGANSEVVSHGRSALLVPPGRPEALAEAVVELHRCPGLSADLARGARERVRARFDLRRSAERYLELYCALLAGEPLPRLDRPARHAAPPAAGRP